MMKNIFLTFCFCFLSSVLFAQTYKIMTYNIRNDNPNDGDNQWSKRKAFLSNQITYNAPDVIGIQEGLHNQVTYLDSSLVNYKYVGIGRDDGKTKGEYSAIFYNAEKLKVVKNATFWLSETPNKVSMGWDAAYERICTYALLKNTSNNQLFWVLNTHFDHIGEEARLESTRLIVKKIEALNKNDHPVIVIGDLNLKPESEPIQYLSSILNDSKIVSLSKPFGPNGTFNGFKFNKPVANRIDYIFTSKENIEVLKYAVLSDNKDCKYPSDHLPVLVNIEIVKH